MNLFTESLSNYLKDAWSRIMASPDGIKEARFITESLDPRCAFDLFSTLEEHRVKALQNQSIECYFRVASGLWQKWLKNEDRGLIDQLSHRKWIDEEDRLTWYRNLTLSEGKDGLVVVLVGLNHASDQGGLADFHLVDEQRVWRQMDYSFVPWIERIGTRLGLDASERDIARFDSILLELFKVRPRRLARLAEFFEQAILSHGNDLYSFGEVIERFYENLSFWGIPPLLDIKTGQEKGGGIKGAEAFISHKRFKSSREQNNAWGKLEKMLDAPEFELPVSLADQSAYTSLDEYREVLRSFVFEADPRSQERLLQSDLLPVLKALKLSEGSPTPRPSKVTRLAGLSFEVILRAVWRTIIDFETQCNSQPIADIIHTVQVVIERFNHDLDDGAAGNAVGLAQELLEGCLGGLPELFEEMDLRLPLDNDQSLLLYSQWERVIPVMLDMEQVSYGTSRARPHICFRVEIGVSGNPNEVTSKFQWSFGPTHPERVRFLCARAVFSDWPQHELGRRMLPAFRFPSEVMTALYFAADADEANRLVSQALTDMHFVNLVKDISPNMVDPKLWEHLLNLIEAFRGWLQGYVDQGYYSTMQTRFQDLKEAYEAFTKNVLDQRLRGSIELLRRFYKAFLLVNKQMSPNDGYLRSAVVWGISPAVLELTHARVQFLRNSFADVVAEHVRGRDGEAAFEQLLNLVEIHRPLAALVVDDQRMLSAEIKSFGFLHYLGIQPSTEKSLAIQTLLREEENDDDDNVTNLIRSTEESRVVKRVLNDYLQLYPFAEDGMRILAVHVEELATILSGVDQFLREYLKQTSDIWPPFHCEVMVYSTSSSPLAMESRLAAWCNHVMQTTHEKGRALRLSVSHHFAPNRDKIIALLRLEKRLYDVAFLFRFLPGELTGEADPALPFKFDFNANNISQFPICEYPRPIQQGDVLRRESLLSNRRMRIQTHHADLSARLRHPQNFQDEHLIFGRINYQPWQEVVESLHGKAQWVACIDPFVDKRLLDHGSNEGQRKIIGFTSGLGTYGELNLSISTEKGTLPQLTSLVKGNLLGLLPFQQTNFEEMAAKVVVEAEEVIGLSSLRAVVGKGEKVREVVGFASIRRALVTHKDADMTQLLPIDSLLHWFVSSDVTHRPDLLQLSLIVRENDIPLIQAVVIECKFSQYDPSHLLKANDQVQDGLSHLTQLLVPNCNDIRRVTFDRRFWWAQLQRVITSRSVVSVTAQERQKLDSALERVAEGYYEIAWQGAIFTFWTDMEGEKAVLTPMSLPAGVVMPPFQIPDQFRIWHIAMGYKGIVALFTGNQAPEPVLLPGDMIRIRPETTEFIPTNHLIRTQNPISESPVIAEAAVKEPEAEVVPPESQVVLPVSEPAIPSVEQITPSEPSRFGVPPDKLLIGTRSNGEPVYWYYGHSKLSNRHMLIFGTSGFGKTYGIQCLLAEMAHLELRSLIIDYTNGFLPSQVESRFKKVANIKNHYVTPDDKLPLNPFRRQRLIIDPSMPIFEETPYQVAARITSIFTSVFDTMGDQQSAVLMRVLVAGISEDPKFSLDKVLSRLQDDDSTHGKSLANKLGPLVDLQPFREGSGSAWESMLTSKDHKVNIFQLAGMSRNLQKLVTEFVLWDLYDYACNSGNKNRPIPVVLDEIQNLDHRSDSPIDKMLREGRKFGLSLILATQNPSQFNSEQRDRLFQAGHKLFFKPADTEMGWFSQHLSQSTGGSKSEWGERLAKLEKGQCWSIGPVLTSGGSLQNKPILVSVTPFEKRELGN